MSQYLFYPVEVGLREGMYVCGGKLWWFKYGG
jgi:hypothetical protein